MSSTSPTSNVLSAIQPTIHLKVDQPPDWSTALEYLQQLSPDDVQKAAGAAQQVVSLNGDGPDALAGDDKAVALSMLGAALASADGNRGRGWRIDISDSAHLKHGDQDLYALTYILLGALQGAGFRLVSS